jgi:hypothetical protein
MATAPRKVKLTGERSIEKRHRGVTMTTSKHAFTAGPASVYDFNRTLAVCIGATSNGKRPCIVDWPGFDSCDLPFEEQRANAHLIAEAFTVAHETGLTPRQLKAEREWFLSKFRELRTALLADHGHNGGLSEASRMRAVSLVRAAIAKTGGAT